MNDLFIPSDVFHDIVRYLETTDCLSWALSGVSQQFIDFYCRKRTWNFSRCYYLKPELVSCFLRKCVNSSFVTCINFSHCYWFSHQILIDCISQFTNLEELYIHDTQLNLTFLPYILKKCQLITHLSVNINEETWEQFLFNFNCFHYHDSTEAWLAIKKGVQELHYLKLYTLNTLIPDVWLLLLQILSWCKNCTHLHLECFYTGCPIDRNEEESSRDQEEIEEAYASVIQCAQRNFLPSLSWMSFLSSFSYVKRGQKNFRDRCPDLIFQHVFNNLKPPNLDVVWIPSPNNQASTFLGDNGLLKSTRALSLGRLLTNWPESVTHLGGVPLESITSPLVNLEYIQGTCTTSQDLDSFCQKHPKLQHLHIESPFWSEVPMSDKWKLLRLKSLTYASCNPNGDAISKMVESCPNVEEVHIGWPYPSNILMAFDAVDVDSLNDLSRLKKLKSLTLSGFDLYDGTFLRSLFGQCRHLESLRLYSDQVTEQFHRDLCHHLPLARNLRDLRLHAENFGDSDAKLVELFDSVRQCRRLQRLALDQDCRLPDVGSALLPQLLGDLVESLPDLVALCFVWMFMSERDIEEIRRQMTERIQRTRPWFWFHIGDEPIKPDASLPRIHVDEIGSASALTYYHTPLPCFSS